MQYASKTESVPNHPTHDVMFDNGYMKLFDAKPNAIHTFGLSNKQLVTASNIDFSDDHISETRSYFVLPPWCIEPPNIVLDLVQLKKDRTYACVYQQLFMKILDRYRDYIHFCTDGSRDGNDVAFATVLP